MRIVVDMDEVLAQFVAKVLKRWNAINGRDIKREQINCWRMEEILGVDTLGRSAEGLIDEWLAEEGFFEDLEPVSGAIEGFSSLRKMGHDVVVATSIPEVAVHSFTGKRRWMRRYFPDWSMKNFIGVSRKGLIDGDILIDDGTHNIEEWLTPLEYHRLAIVFDAPWNQGVDTVGSVRAFNWEDVLRIVDEEMQVRSLPFW